MQHVDCIHDFSPIGHSCVLCMHACRRKSLWDGWGPGHWRPHYPVHGGAPCGGLHQPGAEAGPPTSSVHTEEECSPDEVSGYWAEPTEGKHRYVNCHLVIWFYLHYHTLVVYSLDLLWHALRDTPLAFTLYLCTCVYITVCTYGCIHFSLSGCFQGSFPIMHTLCMPIHRAKNDAS